MFLWEDPVLVLQKKRSCLLICLFLLFLSNLYIYIYYICIFQYNMLCFIDFNHYLLVYYIFICFLSAGRLNPSSFANKQSIATTKMDIKSCQNFPFILTLCLQFQESK